MPGFGVRHGRRQQRSTTATTALCFLALSWQGSHGYPQQDRRLDFAYFQRWELSKPISSNVEDTLQDVRAGVPYRFLTLHAGTGLGTNASAVRVRLVLPSTENDVDCQPGRGFGVPHLTHSYSPATSLDGLTPATAPAQLQANSWEAARFPYSGIFEACYFSGSIWFHMPGQFEVKGADSNVRSFWCQARQTFHCSLLIEGSGLNTQWRLTLVDHNSSCAQASFEKPYSQELSSVSQASTGMVHSMGTHFSTVAKSYRVCYCPGYSRNTGIGFQCTQPEDYVQLVGRLYTTQVSLTHAIYPMIRSTLVIHCGSDEASGCEVTQDLRFRLVDPAPANDEPWYSANNGCRTAPEALGYFLPKNCPTPTSCVFEPTDLAASTPKWSGLQVHALLENHAQRPEDFDVCFCPGSCSHPESWFKVDGISTSAIQILPQPVLMSRHTDFQIYGPSGGWLQTGDRHARELKILFDPEGSMSDADCFARSQDSRSILGHYCYNTQDCKPPTSSSTAGHTWRDVQIQYSGMYAVCYCDRLCSDSRQWSFIKWHLVAGPFSGQLWEFYRGISFDVRLRGWGLGSGDRIRAIPMGLPCGAVATDGLAIPDSPPAQLGGGLRRLFFAYDGTLITTLSSHGLAVDDYVSFTNVTSFQCAYCADLLNGRPHRVIRVVGQTDFVVPVAYQQRAFPVLEASGASWARSSEVTFTAVSAAVPGSYRICWGGNTPSHPEEFAADAGQLTVHEPPVLATHLHLTSVTSGAVTPIVIGFETRHDRKYVETDGRMQLKVVFADTGWLEPGITFSPDESEVPLTEARQSICGRIFKELWSADDDGFPMPMGCYYKITAARKEYCMVFSRKNGLKGGTSYQVVMDAMPLVQPASSLPPRDGVLQLLSLDDVDVNPFGVVELGRAAPDRPVLAAASGTDPQLHANDGLRIAGSHAEIELHYEGPWEVPLEFRAAAGTLIQQGNILRLFMLPLTQWNVETSCAVACRTMQAGHTCSPPMCVPEAVVAVGAGSKRNVLRLTFADMTPISEVNLHQFVLSRLLLPSGGFFATPLAAELRGSVDAPPSFIWSVGGLIYARPLAAGSVVSGTGDGEHLPFRGAQNNILYTRLVLGASIWAHRPGDASLEVRLPSGYRCAHVDPAEDNLNVFSGLRPQGRGEVGLDIGLDGYWVLAGETCTYVLRMNGVVYAGSAIFLKLTVNNPSFNLQRLDDRNEWTVLLHGKGVPLNVDSLIMKTSRIANFSDRSSHLRRNVPVLGKLSAATLSPLLLGAGQDRNWLSVFFTTEQASPDVGSKLVLKVPNGFGFLPRCLVEALPSYHYATMSSRRTGLTQPTLRLQVVLCEASRQFRSSSHLDMATLTLSRFERMEASTTYGFRIMVFNSQLYSSEQHNNFTLATFSGAGDGLDATEQTMRFLASDEEGIGTSFGVYRLPMPTGSFIVSLENMLPYSQSGVRTRIIVFPILVPFATRTNVDWRVVAPSGYEWDFTSEQFLYRRQDLTGATADLPIAEVPSAPALSPRNVLAFVENFKGQWIQTDRYGFIGRIRIPDETPRSSVNAFYIEFGYSSQDLNERHAAASYAAPQVRALVNVAVDYETTNLAGMQNRLIFQVQTITSLLAGGGLVIQSPSGFTFEQSCALMSSSVRTEGFADLSGAASTICSSEVPQETNRPLVTISIVRGEARAGLYEFMLNVQNPTVPRVVISMSWSLFSFSSLAQGETADMSAIVDGFPIEAPMQEALFMDALSFEATGRDDHPDQRSFVTLAFALDNSPPSTDSVLIVKAPLSFTFQAICQVVVGEDVFGESGIYPVGFVPFEATASVTYCTGFRNTARIGVQAGLEAQKKYAFRLEVHNPSVTPVQNQWSIRFGGESSTPFAGYRLWSFTELEVSASHLARSTLSSETKTVVSIRLRPANTIPVGGFMAITAPFGFRIPTVCALQVHRLDSIGQALGVLAPLDCRGTAQPGNSIEAHVGRQDAQLVGLQLYRLDLEAANPSVMPADPGTWRLQSYRNAAGGYINLLDVGEAKSFLLSEVIHEFTVTYPSYVSALEDRLALEVRMVLPHAVMIGDTLEMRGPDGYDFAIATTDLAAAAQFRGCRNFEAISPQALPIPTCLQQTVRFAFSMGGIELESAVQLTPALRFVIQSSYPRRTLDAAANVFHGEHRRGTELMSSRTTPGRAMTPRLLGLSVVRLDSRISVQSLSSLRLGLSPSQGAQALHVTTEAAQGEGQDASAGQFIFSHATISVTLEGQDVPITTALRLNGTLVLEVDWQEASNYLVTMEDVLNPARPGVAFWTLTTFARPAGALPNTVEDWLLPENRRDHSENVAGPETQSRIEMDQQRTVLGTPYFDADSAELSVAFHVMPNMIHAGSYLILQAPVGYAFVDRSFQPGDGFPLVSGMVYAQAPTGGGDQWTYVVQIQTQIQAGQTIKFTLRVHTPRTPADLALWESQHLNSWLFLAAADPQGLQPTASNDRLFPGFRLLGSFGQSTVTPEPNGVTPRKRVTAALDMEPQGALRSLLDGGTVNVRITAPLGFDFDAGCLAVTPHPVFSRCEGFGRIAVLPVADATLPAGRSTVFLWVTNAAVTPTHNWWILESFLDLSSADTRVAPSSAAQQQSSVPGYAVREMLQATVGGNSERGAVTTVLIWFLASHFLDVGGTLELHAPKGYELRCTPGLQFITLPPCTCRLRKGFIASSGDSYHNYLVMNLVMASHLVYPNVAYEFGVSAVNPTELPNPNYWGIILINARREVVDASMNLDGYPLSDYGLYVYGLLPTTTMPAVVCYVTLTMNFQRELGAGQIGHITIKAPTTTKVLCQRFTDMSGGGGTEAQLPLDASKGMFGTHSCRLQNSITLHLLRTQPLRAQTHRLQLGVLNPGLRAQRDFWTVELLPAEPANTTQEWYTARPLLEVQVQGFGIASAFSQGPTIRPYQVDAGHRCVAMAWLQLLLLWL